MCSTIQVDLNDEHTSQLLTRGDIFREFCFFLKQMKMASRILLIGSF
jgi:hypothetical protein